MLAERKRRTITRVSLAAMGLFVGALGSLSLAGGGIGYRNYWGGFVFGPFAIAIGLLSVVVAVRYPQVHEKLAGRRSRRTKGAEKAESPRAVR